MTAAATWLLCTTDVTDTSSLRSRVTGALNSAEHGLRQVAKPVMAQLQAWLDAAPLTPTSRRWQMVPLGHPVPAGARPVAVIQDGALLATNTEDDVPADVLSELLRGAANGDAASVEVMSTGRPVLELHFPARHVTTRDGRLAPRCDSEVVTLADRVTLDGPDGVVIYKDRRVLAA